MDAYVAGARNAKKILYFDQGSVFMPISASPENAEVLDNRKFGIIEVCRLWNVPPPIIQDYSFNAYASASQASIWFATNTLQPIIRKFEAEFSRSVLLDQALDLDVDLSGLVRGSYTERWAATVAAVGAGIITIDKTRAQESYGPMPVNETAPPVAPSGPADQTQPGPVAP